MNIFRDINYRALLPKSNRFLTETTHKLRIKNVRFSKQHYNYQCCAWGASPTRAGDLLANWTYEVDITNTINQVLVTVCFSFSSSKTTCKFILFERLNIGQTVLANDGITWLRTQIFTESIALDLISTPKEYSSFVFLKITTVNHINGNVHRHI